MANLPTLNIGSTTASDYTANVTDYSIENKNLDNADTATEWENSNWSKYWGYFCLVPEFKSAMIMKAIWTVGKGYETDTDTEVILEHITGWGKDTFLDILFNLEIQRRVGGDAFAEIIRDKETDTIINLKPLDPGSMKIKVNSQGLIVGYEQRKADKVVKFKPEEIFHLCHNRIGDQIHGISDCDAIEQTLLAEMENFTDMKKIMHRQAKPMIIWKLKTDDTSKISAFITKVESARNLSEDLFIPDDENLLSYQVIEIDVTQTILAWRHDIRNKFYRAVGLPQVIFGSSGATESGSKVEYL